MQRDKLEKTKVTLGLAFLTAQRVMTKVRSRDEIGGSPINQTNQREMDETLNMIVGNKIRKLLN